MKLTDVPRPFICSVLREATPDATIAEIKLSEAMGAQVFELNLAQMDPQYLTPDALAPVFRSTALPFFTTYRRYGGMGTREAGEKERDDAMRTQVQLDMIDVGSGGIDFEMDTFGRVAGPAFYSLEGIRYSMDPTSVPREVTHDPEAIEKQMRVIEEVHRKGGEVMASCHVLTRITTEDVLSICHEAERRGADMLKVVRFCQKPEDTVDTLATTVALSHEAKIPFVMMAMGEYGRLTRLMSPMLGSMLCYCKRTHGPGTFMDQPLISAAKAVFENTEYRITRRAEEYMPEWYERK